MDTRQITAVLSDVQRGSVHDGPGLRTTVFLKGCPLRCAWCHNPETQRGEGQLSYHAGRCTGCQNCAAACPRGVHRFFDEKHTVNRLSCTACGACVNACPASALTLYGKTATAGEVLQTVLADRAFYEQSGGGVTLSGGEPLYQAAFSAALLGLCKEEGIHTCVETSGFGSNSDFGALLLVTDLFLFDWKVSDDALAERYLGVPLEPIRRNLYLAVQGGKQVLLRCPIIPGVNDNREHFDAIVGLLQSYPSLLGAELLPYHDYGVSKGLHIGQEQARFSKPTEVQKKAWLDYFRHKGVQKVTMAE